MFTKTQYICTICLSGCIDGWVELINLLNDMNLEQSKLNGQCSNEMCNRGNIIYPSIHYMYI